MLVDPTKVTQYDRTAEELETFWLFCLFVAGKNAKVMSQVVTRLLRPAFAEHPGGVVWHVRPLHWLKMLDQAGLLRHALKGARTGKYTLLEPAIRQSFFMDLSTASVDELMTIHGVGPKTARYFVMHTRADQRVAALDTHILSWLRDQGLDAPPVTPSNPKKYAALEQEFLARCDAAGKSPADMDLEIWNARSKNGSGAVAA